MENINAIVNTAVERIKKLELQKKELEEKLNKEKEVVKEIMINEGVDELKTNKYIIRNKEVSSSRFDTKKFKVEHTDLYKAYLVESVSTRFTIH